MLRSSINKIIKIKKESKKINNKNCEWHTRH